MREPEVDSSVLSPHLRIRREERVLPDGCLCHRTAVAAGAIAAYIRYIAELEQLLFQQEQLRL